MTRRELEITDPNRIREILENSKVLHLGLCEGNKPYVVPMNYGYTLENGKLTLYLHGATTGRKLEIICKNPNCFFEMECAVMPFGGKVACQYGTSYSCLMGSGMAVLVEGEEKTQAMSHLMKTQTGKDFSFTDKLVSIVSVIRIDVTEYSAKERPAPMNPAQPELRGK